MSYWIIQLRRATAATWYNDNAKLYDGEFGLEEDTKKIKVGDGVTLWRDLPYLIKQVDNILFDGNTISSTDLNGDIELSPNGSGVVSVAGDIFVEGDAYAQSDKKLATEEYVAGLVAGGGTALILSPDAKFTSKITVRSALTDLRVVGERSIFTVPANYKFLIESMELVTTEIANPGNPPWIRFGNSSSNSEYYESSPTISFADGARYIIESPQEGVASGTLVTFGVTVASGADVHMGVALVTGYLMSTSGAGSSSSSSP